MAGEVRARARRRWRGAPVILRVRRTLLAAMDMHHRHRPLSRRLVAARDCRRVVAVRLLDRRRIRRPHSSWPWRIYPRCQIEPPRAQLRQIATS
uniref:Uncharacterized protein n=1 Tax=Oryza nivara TaxID=4536 RepID=A0A0E0HAW1_ORYNI